MLNVKDTLPGGFFEASPGDLNKLLGGPTLFHLKGEREPALFVSVLLHGNEPAGFSAIQRVLAKTDYGGGTLRLPRSLILFIGNVAAAEAGLRHLPGQPDYNRIWPGAGAPGTPEHKMMYQIAREMKSRGLFASVDLHSTTGMNPHYACVNKLDASFLHLASLFSRTVVYFRLPVGVQSLIFSEFTTAVTVECGKVGDKTGVEHGENFLSACLKLSEFPRREVAAHDVNLYHTVGRVTVAKDASFSFGGRAADIRFIDHLDSYNFNELPAGTILARVDQTGGPLIEVLNEQGRNVTGDYFLIGDGFLKTKARVMPSMLTRDESIIRNDCLCYVMEPYPFALAFPQE